MGLLTPEFFLFLFAVGLVHWCMPARGRVLVLLCASLIFYGYWDPKLLLMLVAVTVANHFIVRRIAAATGSRLIWLRLGVVLQCTLLFTFKYFAFFVDSAAPLAARAGIVVDSTVMELVVPLGLSYFCLKAIALLADTYRGHMSPGLALADHALYLLFFPALTAGPIDRPRAFLEQLRPGARPDWRASFARGSELLFVGILKKSVIANGIAPAVETAFAADFASTGAAVLAALTYAVYIYADFSGYTDIARGVAACLGFDLTINFRRPYGARSASEFWQRWHMSLSTWLRDYVFLPLGGAFGSRRRAYGNLLLTMLIAGLWHGASWMFVLWGLYIGVLLVAHRILQPTMKRMRRMLHLRGNLRRVVETGLTFTLISAGWLLFRGSSLDQVVSAFRGGIVAPDTLHSWLMQVAPFGIAVFILDLMAGDGEPTLLFGQRLPWWGKPVVFAVGLYAFLVLGSDTQSFVYAQF